MPVTNNFSSSSLDLNGQVNLFQPTALVWGPDGKLYVTENGGTVNVLTVAFGDPNPGDGDGTLQFFVTDAVQMSLADQGGIQNHNDDGSEDGKSDRQVTGIDVTKQYDANGNQLFVQADGSISTNPTDEPAVTIYVTSSDKDVGAGGGGGDINLDTNSGVITMFEHKGSDSWSQTDIVRGLPRSEENHATNGLEVIQELDSAGNLVSERMIVASGGNANTGAPSNNFAGQQEQPLSAAILEVDITGLKAAPVLDDDGRAYVYDLPTLDDPTRPGTNDNNDPNGGNDGLNSAVYDHEDPFVTIYSPGYRNAYDVEVTEDGRVWTYDNGANNQWGGRPVGENSPGNGTTDPDQVDGYISTNLNNGDGKAEDTINTHGNWAPSNNDNFHEVTRSDDLDGRSLSEGAFGAPATFTDADGNVQVYGGHPNPTRAEGALAGLLFSPDNGVQNAFLLVSSEDSYGNGSSDYAQVIEFLESEEAANPLLSDGELTSRVLEVEPGVAYDIYSIGDGGVAVPAGGSAPSGGELQGTAGLPADIADIVSVTNKIEGNYLEGGRADGALDSGKGSINGLAEYTSEIFDDGTIKMSGAILATSFGGSIVIMGRNEDGTITSVQQGENAKAADRSTYDAVGQPLGISVVGDDFGDRGLSQAFQGSVWTAVYKDDFSGVTIEVLQPDNGKVPLAGSIPVDPDDADFDGVDKFNDPFEFSADNGYALAAGQTITLDFDANNANFGGSISGTGLLGAALDGPNSAAGPLASASGTDNIQEAGATANQDARTGSYLQNAGDTEDPSLQRDGLFDLEGNIIPGGNAPILQIKEVVPGTMVGTENTARDALHTGINPDADVKRISATMRIDNWIASAGAVAAGQLTGMTYGDGTQSNFLRFVFGEVDGQAGIEVGYEIDDANYTKLAEIPVAALSNSANTKVDLRLEISDIGGSYTVSAQYRVGTAETIAEAAFIDVALGSGFSLPEGVLRNVLDGTHTISDGDTTLASGAAIGVVAETSEGNPLNAIDVPQIDIEAFGNEIFATNEAEAEVEGTSGFDTVIYTGGTADIELADTVENFDGSGSAADYTITGNALDNRIDVGEGENVIKTGDGADTVRGTLSELDGDEITDFSEDDQVVIEGVTLANLDVSYTAGTAVVNLGGDRELIFSGPDFEGFDPVDGPETFDFKQISGGVVLTRVPLEQLVVAINAGTQSYTFDVNGEQVTFLADQGGGAPAAGFLTDGSEGGGGSKIYNGGGSAGTVQAQDFGPGALTELHWDERSSNEKYYGYEIPVAENGTYRVDIYSAEIFHGVVGGTWEDNKRVFDVVIEGETVADNFDHYDIDPSAPATEIIHSYEFEITDGAFTLDIDARGSAGGIDQPKLSAFALYKIGAGTAVTDTQAPIIASITVGNPQGVQDDARDAIITLTDNTGFDAADFAGLNGSELGVSGIVPAGVSAPDVTISSDGKTATLVYTLTPPADGWDKGVGEIAIAADAYVDAAGNGNAATTGAFVFEPNLGNQDRGAVVFAVNVGTTDTSAATNLAPDPLNGDAIDNNRYAGAIAADSVITDAFGNPIAFEADNAAYYTSPKGNGGLNNNVDGQLGSTGSNAGGIDLDGSALHTYRDSNAATWTATYDGFDAGTYVVELHFAELFHATAGSRVGTFTVNGIPVAENYDAFAAAGGADAPSVVRQAVTVTDGTITVEVASSVGQAGYSAIVVYEAVDSTAAPVISVADTTAEEGEDASVLFTRAGSLTDAITVDYAVSPDTADTSDFVTAATGQIIIPAGQLTAELLIPITDDADAEAAEGFTVTITGVSNAASDAVTGDGEATVTIAPSDNPLASAVPDGGAVFALDFETDTNDPIADGVFDTVLGPEATAYIAADAAIADGKLKIQTADGDLSQAPDDASKNDLVKAVDLSSSDINEIYIRTVVDNPFDAAFFASLIEDAGGQNITPGVVANYAQLGIVIGVDDPTLNQDGTQFIKLIFGGNSGNATQMWTPDEGGVTGLNQVVKLPAVGTAAGQTIALEDIAKVELALVIDKAAGTIGQIVTYYDDAGNVLGGVRPAPEAGFATAAPLPMTAAVANAIASGETVVGVTTSDFQQAGVSIPSFEAAFDLLEVTSPQISTSADLLVSIADAANPVTESGDLENDLVIFELATGDGFTGDLDVTFSLDGGDPISTIVAFVNGVGALEVDVPHDSRWNGETAEVTLVSIDTDGFAVDAANAVATATVLEDDPADTALGTVYGDLSDDRFAPTDIGTLALGDNEVSASQQGDGAPGGRDRDYFTFTVAEGQALSGLVLTGYITSEESPAQGFMGIQEGSAITVDPITGAPDDGADPLLSGLIFGDGQQGTDLLPSLAEGGEIQTGAPIFAGFDTPLGPGTYTLWLNQGGPSTSVSLNLVTSDPSVLELELSIANAPTVLEAGDTGSTALTFAVTANDPAFSGDVTVDYTVDGLATQSVVTFTDGAGAISVDVANDGTFSGDATVDVVLTAADNGSDTFTVSATAAAASGIVRDDDVGTYERGDIVLAINAGGPQLTQDGILFAASAGNAAPFSDGTNFADNNGGNGPQPAFDTTVFETEVNDNGTAGGGAGQGFSFSAPVDPNKSYFVDLYFAEIYASAVGARQFDVEAEGTLILDDFDVLDETGGDINKPVVFALTDPIQPGANGAIDLSFIAEADRAKVSAIVIREAKLAKGDLVFAINAGGEEFTDEDGVVFAAADASEWSGETVFGNGGPATVDYDGDGDIDGSDALYKTEFYGGKGVMPDLTFTRGGLEAGDYVLTLKFAEIFATEDNKRVFDVAVNGQTEVINDLDIHALAGGKDKAYDVALPVTIGADGTLTVALDPSIDNAKISALTLHRAPTLDGVIAIGDAPTVLETGDTGATTLEFPFTITGPDETVDITFTVNGGPEQSATLEFDGGVSQLALNFLNDDLPNGPDAVDVVITGTTTPGILVGQSTATGVITDDETIVGTAPDEDLDGDLIANADDPDVDGDGALNGDETFSYDATNEGISLANREMVLLDFETDGTPFQNGFTGALDSPKASVTEVNLDNADVSGGALNITVTGGDAFQGNNTQQNAFVAGYRASEGLVIETKFAAPDFDAATAGVQTPVNFQSAGLVIGLDQNNLTKVVFGRTKQEFEFGTEIAGTASNTATDPLATNDYAAISDVLLTLEVFIDTSGAAPAAVAKATATLLDADGAPLVGADTIDLGTKPLTGALGDAVLNGDIIGVGVIHTANGNKPAFDVSYEYLKVQALGDAELSIGDAAEVVEGGDTGTTTLEFPVTASAPVTEDVDVAITVTGVADGPTAATVSFVDGAAVITIEVANDDLENGTEAVSVTIDDIVSEGFVLAADAGAGSVTEDDAAPVAVEDAVSTFAATPITFDPAANDTDADLEGGALKVTAIDGVDTADYTFSLDPDTGEVTVTPLGAFTGDIAFGYTVEDPAGNATQGTATVTVSAATPVTLGNAIDVLETGDDGVTTLQFAVTAADAANASIDMTVGIGGGELVEATVVLVEGAGTLSIDVANDDLANGPDEISPFIVDIATPGFAPAGDAQAIGVVIEDDAAPVALADAFETETGKSITFDPAANDTDADLDGGALKVTAIDGVDTADYTFSLDPGTGEVTVTPVNGFIGDIAFGYTVEDSAGNAATGTATVTVTEPSGPTRIEAEDATSTAGFFLEDQTTASEGQVIRLAPNGTGQATFDLSDFEPGTYNIVIGHYDENDGESDVSLSLGDQSYAWTLDDPNGGNAAQSQSFRTETWAGVTIGEGATTLTLDGAAKGNANGNEFVRIDYIELIKVDGDTDPDNQAPFAPIDVPVPPVAEDETATFDLTGFFFDPDEDPLTFSLDPAVHADDTWVSVSPEGVLSLAPTATESDIGDLTVTVIAEDGRGGSVSKDIAITVTPVDDAPVSSGIEPQALESGAAFDLDVTAFFTDEDSATLTYDYTGTLPTGVTFNGDPLAGPIGFIGTPEAIGSFGGQLSVSDGTSTIFETIVFNVTGTDDREGLKIEAEDATTQSPGLFDISAPAASNGEVIGFPAPGGSGEATFVLPDEFVAGSYEIKVVYFDESDGESTVTLSVGDTDIGTWTFDDDGGGNAAQAANIRERKFTPDEDLEAGSVIKLTAARDAGEWVRIDYIELIPTSADANFAPTVLFPLGTVDYDGTAALAIDLNAVGEFNLPVFTDQEEDALTFSKIAGPDWLQVSPEGIISGTPDKIGDYTVTVGATDVDGSNVTVAETFTLAVTGLPPENLPPTVTVTQVVTELAENADTSASTKIADIVVSDGDDIGTNEVSLSGADAGAFEIVDNAGALELHLKSGTALDFETKTAFDVTVEVDDASIGAGPEDTSDLTLAITDVLDEPVPDEVIVRINAFGDAVAATDGGPDWQADGNGNPDNAFLVATDSRGDTQGYSGDTGVIPTTVPPSVLDTARSSDAPFSYAIPVANGTYIVNLFIAELFTGGQTGDFRIFDGLLEGVVPVAYDNIDPGADFGGGNVGVLTAEAVVTDGVLNIGFAQDAVDGKQNPIVNAIEVVKKGFAPDLDGPDAAIAIVNPATDADPLVINVTLTDETGVDETSLDATDLSVSVGGTAVAATDITFTGFADGIATYAVAAPAGGWVDASTVDVTVNAGAISDSADAGNANAAATAQATLDVGATTGDDTVILRINAFGPTVAATDGGPAWQSDLKDDPGTAENENSPYLNLVSTDPAQDRGDPFGFAGTPPAGVPNSVMGTARSSNEPFSYDIPVADLDGNGNYTITLHFAELFTGNQVAGERSFDVAIEGQSIGELQDVDPAALGGGAGASSISYNVAVTDGELNIAFNHDQADNPIINAIEVSTYSGEIEDPGSSDPTEALPILQALSDVDDNGNYGAGDVGSAKLEIMTGNNNVASSNFSPNSFELTNTGDKQIAAVVIDFRNALYGDSVVDPDGQGGDSAAKPFAVNSDGNTGGFFGSDAYQFAGEDPLANTTGTGNASNGGFRGLLLKFDGSDGGFSGSETVGFSGDMDPNSVAGLVKGDIDDNTFGGWDVGGISGAELIGSSFTVLFDDGTTATGYLGSDGSQAGSQGEAVEGRTEKSASVTVNGASTIGTYGVTEPEIIVSGTPGDTVLVTMSKGFNAVTNDDDGIADLVADRLADANPAFQVNNAANFQTVEVTIGADGTATVPPGAFSYNNATGGGENVDGFATAPMVIAASVIDGDDAPLGPVDRVYLTNSGGPVEGEGEATSGVYEVGSDGFIAIEFESLGLNPPSNWEFANDDPGFTGDGFYRWADPDIGPEGVTPKAEGILNYVINVTEAGVYDLNLFVSRGDNTGGFAGDSRNDVWVAVDGVAPTDGNRLDEAWSADDATSVAGTTDWQKLFGGPFNTWGWAETFDDQAPNPDVKWEAEVYLTEGQHTISFAGRSNGYQLDRFHLTLNGDNKTSSAPATDPIAENQPPTVANAIADQVIEQADGYSFEIPANTFSEFDGDDVTIEIVAPAGFTVDGTTITADASIALGTYTIVVTATDKDGSATDTFEVEIVEEITSTPADFQAVVEVAVDDIEIGSSPTSSDLETDKVVQLRFTVQDGVANVTSVDEALVSWVSDRGQGGSSTLTFQVENSLDAEGFGTGKSFVGGAESAAVNGGWADGATITNVVDLADQLNALIAAQGPLNAGDTINVQITGAGATRYIEQASAVIDISGQSNGTGDPIDPPPPTGDDILTFALSSGGVPVDADLEAGDTVTLTDLDAPLLISGVADSEGNPGSVALTLSGPSGQIASQVENVAPFDISFDGAPLSPGSYTLEAVAYAGAGQTGDELGTQTIAFTIADGSDPGGPVDPPGPTDGSVTWAIASQADDKESSGSVNSNDLEFRDGDSIALRFTGGDLPDGAEVTRAQIQFTAENDSDAEAQLQILLADTESGLGNAQDVFDFVSKVSTTQAWDEALNDGDTVTIDVLPLLEQVYGDGLASLDGGDTIGLELAMSGLDGEEVHTFSGPGGNGPKLILDYASGNDDVA